MHRNEKINLATDLRKCCGCGACYSVCPVNAIEMVNDLDGHYYPKINKDVCIKCHKCEKVCAFKIDAKKSMSDKKNPIVYALKLKNLEERKKSSSGGAFTAVSDLILNNGGAIACTIYDYKDNLPKFKIIENKEERNLARGSKYIQSDSSEIYKECLCWLNTHPEKKLLFIGTGCQVAAFNSFMNFHQEYKEQLILVDLICHGVPSARIWKDSLNLITDKLDNAVSLVEFKDKSLGWNNPLAYVIINNEKYNLDLYSNLFYSGLTLRPSCFNCPYATVRRDSDLTIGDFWGIESVHTDFYDEYGVSLVLIHSKKGEEVFADISDDVVYKESEINSCLQPRLLYPSSKPKKRAKFWKDYTTEGSSYAICKYGKEELAEKKRLIKRIYRKMLIKR